MTTKVGGLGLLGLTLFIAISFIVQLNSAPPRMLSARLDPFGDVNVHLQTQPDPPKTGGIPLILHITDASGQAVAVDQVKYEYWKEERAPLTLTGESSDGSTFQAIAELDSVGDWQVRVTLFKGSQQTQMTFTLRVMPNI
ncbi:MAG: hypothetical protein HY741_23130 [Chloroflexi bacterium]|nr:hypothetical protein [Chloroflexota bacterium]